MVATAGPIAAQSEGYGKDTGTLSMFDRAEYLWQAGFRGDDLAHMIAISQAESGGRYRINNAGLNSDGSVDWGWLQINSSAHPWFDTSRAYDPLYNAQSAFRVYEQAGNSLNPWVAHKSGASRQFLPEARSVVEQFESRAQNRLTAERGGRQPLMGSERRTAAVQMGTGMMQGFGDAAREQGRAALMKRRRTGNELHDRTKDLGDTLVQAADAYDAGSEEDLLQRVRPQFQEVQLDERAVGDLHFESEGALLNLRPGELDRPSSWEWGGYSNGEIPRSALANSQYQANHWFRPEAATAFDAMFEAARADGVELGLTDSYRDYATQVSLKQRKPGLAATPGRSNHGWGVAIDVASQEARQWIQQNGERFGWYWPEWARPGGSGPDEDWHFEFYAIGGGN